MNKSVSELIKNTLIMLAITLVSGGILGVVYEMTKEPIAVMEQKKTEEANKQVFVTASSFSDNILDKEKSREVLGDLYKGVEITEVLKAFNDNGEVIGYVFEITSHEGYGGDIVFRVGFQEDGTTNGISFTSISETAGLGMRADEVLTPQFYERKADTFVLTKNGAVFDNEIDAISSATITSTAVVNGVNAGLLYLREITNGGGINE